MANPIVGKNIVLGVTGSIAAYKAADIASKLSQQGAQVTAILTQPALEFISPLTFQSVTGVKAYMDEDLWGGEGHVVHVQIGHTTDLLVIAPASANTIAKLANGLADNLLTVTALAAACPILIAPAMDAGMYGHPATQKNIEILKSRGVYFIGPDEGHLASGLVGPGRMSEPSEIAGFVRWLLSRKNPLKGKKIVITAGGTREAIDPVRYISNRSSGKQGYALAQAALDYGAEVTLISTPTSLKELYGSRLVQVQSADEMYNAVMAEIEDANALIMSAAVADFTPSEFHEEKIKKDKGFDAIKLTRTRDIIAEAAKMKREKNLNLKIIGFAAESENLKNNAKKKMTEKEMDMIVANDITEPQAGFSVDTNKVLLMFADGSVEQLPLLQKSEVSEKVIQHLASWLMEGAG